MTYCYFFQMLGNLSLFYFVANSFLYAFQLKISLFPTILLALACSLGFFLNQKKPKLRYLSIIFMPLALLSASNLFCALLILLSIVFCAENIIHSRFSFSYEERLKFFYLFFKVLVVCFFPVTISDVFHSLYIPDSLAKELNFLIPFALMFLVSTILLLQILRHDDSMIVKRKFKLTYISVFIGIFFVIFIISSPMFLSFLAFLLKTLYTLILGPLIIMLGSIIGSVLWFIIQPFYPYIQSCVRYVASLIKGERSAIAPESDFLKDFISKPTASFGEFFHGLFSLTVIVVSIYVLIRLLKKMRHHFHYSSVRQSRSTLNEKERIKEDIPLDLAPPGEPRKAVRYYYRCFLHTCKTLGLLFSPDANSFIVARDAREYFQEESLHKLYEMRDIYIKARYSKHQIKSNDVNQIKLLYEELSQEEIHQKKKKIPKKDEMLDASYVHLPPKEHENFDHLQN